MHYCFIACCTMYIDCSGGRTDAVACHISFAQNNLLVSFRRHLLLLLSSAQKAVELNVNKQLIIVMEYASFHFY